MTASGGGGGSSSGNRLIITVLLSLLVLFQGILMVSHLYQQGCQGDSVSNNGQGFAAQTVDKSARLFEMLAVEMGDIRDKLERLNERIDQELGPTGSGTQQSSASSSLEKDRRSKMLLIALPHSGGPYLGQILDVHEGVFFVADACKGAGVEGMECSSLLGRLLNCAFTTRDAKIVMLDTLERQQSSALEKMAEYFHGTRVELRDALRASCRQSEHVVVSEVGGRIRTIDSSLGVDNLRVVDLVRDPRAVSVSFESSNDQQQGQGDVAPYMELPAICQRIKARFQSALALLDERQYTVIKEEMLHEQPAPTIKSVYKWGGLGKVPRSVLDWIESVEQGGRGGAGGAEDHGTEGWTQEVSPQMEARLWASADCRYVLNELGYEKISFHTETEAA